MKLRYSRTWLTSTLAAMMLMPAVLLAADTEIGPEISGSWYDPAQSGHGLTLQLLDNAAEPTLLLYWFVWEIVDTQALGPAKSIMCVRKDGRSGSKKFGEVKPVVVELQASMPPPERDHMYLWGNRFWSLSG